LQYFSHQYCIAIAIAILFASIANNPALSKIENEWLLWDKGLVNTRAVACLLAAPAPLVVSVCLLAWVMDGRIILRGS